jgi:hypothetical protein
LQCPNFLNSGIAVFILFLAGLAGRDLQGFFVVFADVFYAVIAARACPRKS